MFNPLNYTTSLHDLQWNKFSAWTQHVPFAFFLIEALKPSLFVELGTHYGTSYFSFCQTVQFLGLTTRCYAIDHWKGDPHAGAHPDGLYDLLFAHNQSHYHAFSTLIRADFETALSQFEDNSIDVLHIDAYHTYEAVQHDWLTWKPKLSDSAIVLFHDTNVYQNNFGVWQLWDELKTQYPSFAFLHGHGLGVLAVGKQVPSSLQWLFELDIPNADAVRRYFMALGEKQKQAYDLIQLRSDNQTLNARLQEIQASFDEQFRQQADHLNTVEHERDAALAQFQLEQQKLKAKTIDLEQVQGALLRQKAETQQIYTQVSQLTALQKVIEEQQLVLARSQKELALEKTLRSNEQKSLAWRITNPLRSVKRRFPRATHRVKGLFKRLWWLVTGRLKPRLNQLRIMKQHASMIDSLKLVDTAWYLDQYPDVQFADMSPTWHYLTCGARENRNPNPLFDGEWYLQQYPDVAAVGTNPLLHYVFHGESEGRQPSPDFAPHPYLKANPDVARSGMNALAHYLNHGIAENRPLKPSATTASGKTVVPAPKAPEFSLWKSLPIRDRTAQPTIDVVIPVYGQYDETLHCIYMVLSAPQSAVFSLVVIDDASPDSALQATLDQLSRDGLIHLIRHSVNRGFVQSVNEGFALHPERDVVILNSDTAVYNDWLDRLHAAAYRRENIGSVTPFSNNAEIASYPILCNVNDTALELDDKRLDALFAQVNHGEYVEAPTGIGFCMYLRRDCLKAVGEFNVALFGRGYGEENDFCQRAIQAGWVNILAGDVFVRHYGGVSFGKEKAARIDNALKTIDRLYPHYHQEVAQFITADSPRFLRQRVDLARLKADSDKGAILFISHTRGGGTEQHIQEMRDGLNREGIPNYQLQIKEGDSAIVFTQDGKNLPNLPVFAYPYDLQTFITVMQGLHIKHLHIHHLIGQHYWDVVELLQATCQTLGIAYDFTIHDYLAVCPRINLINGQNQYCGEPAIAGCETCIKTDGSEWGKVAVWQWRKHYGAIFTSARKVFVPDIDVAKRIKRYFPDLQTTLRPHKIKFTAEHPPHRQIGYKRTRRIAVLGALSIPKGFEVMLEVARIAAYLKLPLEFVIVGYTNQDDKFQGLNNIQITGKYDNATVQSQLQTLGCDVAWFPAIWPETFSYTLSIAIEAGLYPVAFDFGAIGERIRAMNWGHLMPIEDMNRPQAIADSLVKLRIAAPPSTLFSSVENDYHSLIQDYYELDDAVFSIL